MNQDQYSLMYQFKILKEGPRSISKEEAKSENLKNPDIGACDSLILVSILKGEEVISHKICSFDGFDQGQVSTDELFRTVISFALKILNSTDAKQWQKDLCKDFFEKCQEEICVSFTRE